MLHNKSMKSKDLLTDVDISPNLNTFNFWTSESEYIKKTGIRIHLFGQNPYESIYGLESEYISFFAIEYEYNYLVRDMDLSPRFGLKNQAFGHNSGIFAALFFIYFYSQNNN